MEHTKLLPFLLSFAVLAISLPSLLFGQGGQSIYTQSPLDGIQPSVKIIYVREDIPNVPFKPYTGRTYDDTIPDTLDIAERADLAINCLTGNTDPKADYEQYFFVEVRRNPPVMIHDFSDWCQSKFMEALPLLRLVNGSGLRTEVDKTWQNVTLKRIGPDGLFYMPIQGRPWLWERLLWFDKGGVVLADGNIVPFSDSRVTQTSHPFICGRMIGVMLVYYKRDHNPLWMDAIRKMIDRLAELVIYKENYAYFPDLHYMPNAAKVAPDNPRAAEPAGCAMIADSNSRLIEFLARYYAMTGYQPARDLAEKLTRFIRFHADFYGDPKIDRTKFKHWASLHFHSFTISMLNILELAMATGDKELIQYVQSQYEWAKSSPEACSSDLVGFFPEGAQPDYDSYETCELADMIALALKMSAYGVADYYQDAERWTRNQFIAGQFIRSEWIDWTAESMPKTQVKPNESADHVGERSIGAFAGWASANDGYIYGMGKGLGIMQCCTSNACRSLYHIWKHTLQMKDGELRLNMLLNRASPWADVHSYIPYEGQVDLKIKTDCKRVLVHAPEWIQTGSADIIASIDGKPCQTQWQDRYLDLGPAKPGQTLAVKFPIAERTVKETIGAVNYRLLIKGSTVVRIDPPGRNYPLYQRDHYRENQTRWRTVKRYIADDEVNY